MTTPADLPSNYRFADLTLDVARRRVTREGQSIELKALDFDLLRFLVEQAPNVINADVLAEKVWGRHFVSPENVAQRVMLLRQSLSDDANKPRYIETVRNKGYRLIPVVEPVQGQLGPAPRGHLPVPAIAAGLLVAVGVTVAAAYWLAGSAEQPPPSPTSIAVLPFEDLSPNPDDASFAAGMQDEIANQLTKLSGFRVILVRPGTRVPESITEIVRSLNVATTLGGSVYYSEGRLRIKPRLTEAGTGVWLWSNTYERERRDIFAIQSEIALEVARELSVELSLAERTRVERAPTTNTQALDYYLNAKHRHDRLSLEEMRLALAELEQALSIDPKFADAWVLSSFIHTSSGQWLEPEHLDEHRVAARRSAEQALALDPELAAAHSALAGSLLTTKDWAAAESAFAEAMRLSTSIEIVGGYAFLRMSSGHFETFARDAFEQVRATDYQSEGPHRFLALVHAHMGDWDRANAVYESALRLFANDDRAVRALQEQRMHWLVGRGDLTDAAAATIRDAFNAQMVAMLHAPRTEALATLSRAFETSADGNPNHHRDIALWAGHFGDPQLALAALRKVVNAQPAQMAHAWMPQLAPMRALPEFEAYMREIGMVAYWQEYGWPPFCWEMGEQDFECH